MTDTAPIDDPYDARRDRHLDEIPAMRRMLGDIHAILVGDVRTGTPGLLEGHREHTRRLTEIETRCARHSERIHAVEAAPGNTARHAWWEALKIALIAIGSIIIGRQLPPGH